MLSNVGEADAGHPDVSRRRRWLIVLLLFLVQVANSADKSVLGLAAKPMMQELGLDIEQYGLLASSFYSLFAVGGLLVAFFVAPHVRPRHILAALLFIWSVSQLPIVFAASFTTVIACRVLLGMGEGAGTPTALTCCHEWFANKDRNMPSALVMFGTSAGFLLAAPVLSYTIQLFGWRAAFLACSLLGVAILALWLTLGADGPFRATTSRADVPSATHRAISQRAIWSDPTVIGICLLGFAAYWLTGFAISWLAPFITLGLGFKLLDAGWVLSVIYASHALLLLSISFYSQRLLQSGRPSRLARGVIMGLCMAGSGVAFAVAAMVSDISIKLVAVTLATGLPGPIYPLLASMISEIAPAAHRNRLLSLILAGITTAGMLSPALAGWLISGNDASGWSQALLLQGGVAAIGSLVALAMLHPERSIQRFARLGGQ
ncbi:hypothetical protein ASE00_09630 [Sphingomonas sp. Root710]|uniref:MFS transporter n=1 Tax=Sphingomonas sp. Root710 TaxID=1736594 RepID=UPI0006FBB2B8|nr:MFS transporter [Sphingomonas sp. Root710]KRB82328.1 hypothetical protein ASE00_09630 [Sphingomonas sp. Root710]